MDIKLDMDLKTDTEEVEILGRETLHVGFLRLDRLRLRHRRFDGGWTQPLSRELVIRGPAVGVLPYDPVRDEVVLIEEFRVGSWATGRDGRDVEIVAGIMEEGESPEAMAAREMQEEAGLSFSALEKIAAFLPNPGHSTELVILYCARVDAANAGGLFGMEHEGEDIRAFVVSADAAIDLLNSGRIGNATALVALQWFALHREALRKRWLDGV